MSLHSEGTLHSSVPLSEGTLFQRRPESGRTALPPHASSFDDFLGREENLREAIAYPEPPPQAPLPSYGEIMDRRLASDNLQASFETLPRAPYRQSRTSTLIDRVTSALAGRTLPVILGNLTVWLSAVLNGLATRVDIDATVAQLVALYEKAEVEDHHKVVADLFIEFIRAHCLDNGGYPPFLLTSRFVYQPVKSVWETTVPYLAQAIGTSYYATSLFLSDFYHGEVREILYVRALCHCILWEATLKAQSGRSRTILPDDAHLFQEEYARHLRLEHKEGECPSASLPLFRASRQRDIYRSIAHLTHHDFVKRMGEIPRSRSVDESHRLFLTLDLPGPALLPAL